MGRGYSSSEVDDYTDTTDEEMVIVSKSKAPPLPSLPEISPHLLSMGHILMQRKEEQDEEEEEEDEDEVDKGEEKVVLRQLSQTLSKPAQKPADLGAWFVQN